MKTLQEIEEGLQLLGYDARIEGQSVAFEICRFLAVLTVTEDTLNVTCEVALGSELGDEAPIFMLDMNTIITPYAFAINSAKSDGAEDDRVVLIDSVSLISFTQEELEQLTSQLQQALYLVGPMLRQKMNYSSDRAKLYFDSNELWDEMDLLDDLLLLEIIGMGDIEVEEIEEVEVSDSTNPIATEADIEISESEATPVRVSEPEPAYVAPVEDDSTRRSSDSGYSSFSDSSSSDSGSSYGGGDSGGGCDCGGGCD